MHVVPDNVYVIPPNTYMSIVDGTLTLSPRLKSDNGIHSVDFFLLALAKVYQHHAIAIILSGTAYDGTEGVQAIKAEGGITFAQDESAKFLGMPVHAAESGFVDYVLSPDKIAHELASLVRDSNGISLQNEALLTKDEQLRKIYMMLHHKKAVDFSYYKKTTINRRILRRMTLNRLHSLSRYVNLLRDDQNELELLYKDLLINVTSFFRDPLVYKALSKKIFPAILKDRKASDPIRIWTPACATGEEPYSIAICLFEYLNSKGISIPVQIFATDLNEQGIEKARIGIYQGSALLNVSKDRLKKFFTKLDGKYQVTKAIRDICIFAPHNLLTDPPFSRMSLISCQNVMIYLEANPQKKILQTFHYALKPKGFLLLGKSESVGNSVDLFEQTDKDLKIYMRRATPANLPQFEFTIRSSKTKFSTVSEEEKFYNDQLSESDIEKEADKLLLSKYVPASVVVNNDLNIIRFQGATGEYLHPAQGKASLYLLKMVREELLFEVRSLIQKAKKEQRTFIKEKIPLSYGDGMRAITLEVAPVKTKNKESYYLVIFKSEPVEATQKETQSNTKKKGKADPALKRITSLQRDLKEARFQVKAMSEEFESNREELQTANEEVLSSNEELQSINEELETSKEELQSTNEELITINEELRLRNNDLKESRDYVLAIVETIHEPLIVINPDMTVRTANRAFYRVFKTTPEDTEGHLLFKLQKGDWNIEELKNRLSEISLSKKTIETFEIKNEFTLIGEKILLFYAMRMDQADNNKGRVMLAIEDITQRKLSEKQLKESEENFRLLVQNSADIITVFGADGTIQYQSESVYRILGYSPSETVGKNIFFDSFVHPEDRSLKEAMFKRALATPQENIMAEFRLRHKNGTYRIIEAVCINQLNDLRIRGIVANYRDVTEKRKLEKQKEEFIGIASHELKTPVTSIKAYTEILREKFREANDDVSAELARKMEHQVDRLTHLITELLDTTKISEGQLQFEESYFDMNALINEVVDEMQLAAHKHKLTVKLKMVPQAWGDRERISQVVTNLISNAIKYSPKQNSVVISSSADEENITVSVQDFGIGIANDIKDKVFNRFFRANEGHFKSFPGLGLGLYISSEIIKRQNGKIWVESEKDKGSVFSFSLPFRK